jgi:hypothetical protein
MEIIGYPGIMIEPPSILYTKSFISDFYEPIDIRCACILGDNTLAIGLYNGDIEICDLIEGKVINKIESGIFHVKTLCPHPNGSLMSITPEGEIKQWL